VDVARETTALLDTDRAWAAAADAGTSADSILSFWTDDARVISPNEAIVAGKAALKAMVTGSLAIPGFHLTWTPEQAVVSTAGDLGYTYGTNRMTVPDSTGKTITMDGRYVTVWRKDADGRWRCVQDIFNNGPAPGKGPA
jgi:ketosteroid isomerase-like protein